MIKIIISGTSDGFYPRYASDGVLDDDITNHLVDRRHYLSKEADRLSREGYSFQVLAKGVLFHKIIPLFDAFGRDGFMMASLYLPDGEKLKGAEIKEALDAIIREYKMHTVGGMANVELDWSFVQRKADEMNKKVYPDAWRRHPSPTNVSRTALMKGADNRIAEYFEYPNPLLNGFSGYEQVFLTERLLDPALESSDGEQGYKVLTKDDVDIDNPTYVIDYVNPNGYSTRELKHEVTKKELDAPGSFLCGELCKDGYRKRPVIIPEGKKQSQDGETIKVELPTLVPKQASVFLKVVDSKTGDEIPWGKYSVSWKSSQNYDSSWDVCRSQSPLSIFEKEECDQKWKVRVECDQYEENELSIDVNDRDERKLIPVTLRYDPDWTIKVISPINGGKRTVRPNEKNSEISRLKKDLEKLGLEVVDVSEKSGDRIVEVVADFPLWDVLVFYGTQTFPKKQVQEKDLEKIIEELKDKYKKQGLVLGDRKNGNREVELHFVKKQEAPVNTGNTHGENVFKDPSRNGTVTEPELPKEPEKKKWVLILNSDSKNYSLFKNYKRGKNKADRAIATLDTAFNQYTNNDAIKSSVSTILQHLKNGEIDEASEVFYSIQDKTIKTDMARNLVDSSYDAIKDCNKFKKTPKVVTKPEDVFYFSDKNSHRLEVCSENKPDDKIELGQDCYSYRLESCHWMPENQTQSGRSNKVKRTLRPVYKFLWFVLPLLVIGGATALYFFVYKAQDDVFESLKKEVKAANEILQSQYSNHYCDDDLFEKYDNLLKNYNNHIGDLKKKEKQDEAMQDTLYRGFVQLMDEQNVFKETDSLIYVEFSFLNERITKWSDTNKQTWERIKVDKEEFEKTISCMSNTHNKMLSNSYSDRLKEEVESLGKAEEERLKNEEKVAYDNCFKPSATTSTCTSFIRKYSNMPQFTQDVDAVNEQKNRLDQAERATEQNDFDNWCGNSATFETVTKYLAKYEKDSRFIEHVKDAQIIKQSLLPQKKPDISGKTPLKTHQAVFDALTWGVVNGGMDTFNDKYVLTSETSKYYKRIVAIVQAVKSKKDNESFTQEEYDKMHEEANNEKNPGDKVTKLEQKLGIK